MTASRDPKDTTADNALLTKFPRWPSVPKQLHVVDVSLVLSLVGDLVLLLFALVFSGLWPFPQPVSSIFSLRLLLLWRTISHSHSFSCR